MGRLASAVGLVGWVKEMNLEEGKTAAEEKLLDRPQTVKMTACEK